MISSASISSRLEKGVGFSRAFAEFAPLYPPPFVPSCFGATWLACGPIGTICCETVVPSSSVTDSISSTVS